MPKTFLVAVTNDLNQDQRMHRICNTLVMEGYHVLFIGREKSNSQQTLKHTFDQKRLRCLFSKGFLFYLEFNLRLFFFGLRYKPDVFYAVDLDTLLGMGLSAKWCRKKLVHDAHEYFVEVPELEGRGVVKSVWNRIGNHFVPRCDLCFTVNEELVGILSKRYNNEFHAIRSVPYLFESKQTGNMDGKRKVILYQGVLNQGRGLEASIKAVHHMDENVVLKIAGEGDLSKQLRTMVDDLEAHDKIEFLGWLTPDELKEETRKADVGLNLLTGKSLNYKYSLANKFFDYMHAGIPSINMDFPVYRRICREYEVGVCIDKLEPETIQSTIRELIHNQDKIDRMKKACDRAKAQFNWGKESKQLITLIKSLF